MFLTRNASITRLRKLKIFACKPMCLLNTVKTLIRQNKDLEKLHLTFNYNHNAPCTMRSFMEIICELPKLKNLTVVAPSKNIKAIGFYIRKLEKKGCRICTHGFTHGFASWSKMQDWD